MSDVAKLILLFVQSITNHICISCGRQATYRLCCVPDSMQDGTSEYDAIKDASGGDDESIHMAGETEGSWHGSNVGGFDFAAVTLSPDGVELSRWQVI